MSAASPRKARARHWPILAWVPGYQRGWLRVDLIAGLTVCAILVPEGMAYAGIAGVPPEAAFYAAPIALLAYAILGSSNQLVVAVSSAIAIMSAATVSDLASQGTPEYIALTAGLALLAGLVSILAGVLKLGRIAQFFSESVLTGFVFGLALLITVKQLPKLLGIEPEGEFALQILIDLIPKLGQTHLATLVVGAADIAALILLEKALPKVPSALVVLVGSIAASALLGLADKGVAVVGALPAGLVPPSLPGVGLSSLPLLLVGAVGIALVAFAEAIGPANDFAQAHGGTVDPNRELIAIGASNAGAGLFSGFPIGSSLSKSAANDRAGAKSPASLVTAAAATAMVALFLTPLFAQLPEATLGAVVVVAVSGMMKFDKMARLRRLRPIDFRLALVALAGVLVMPTLPALGLAVVASLALLVWRTSEPRITFLGRASGSLETVALRAAPDAAVPGLVIARPDQMLFFANAEAVREQLLAAVSEAEPPARVLLLDLSLTPELDVPVVEMLDRLHRRLASSGVPLWLCHVRPAVRDLLERSGTLAAIGPDHVYDRVSRGIIAFLRGTPAAGERIAVLADLAAYAQQRQSEPGTSAVGIHLLATIEARLRAEIAATGTDSAGGRDDIAP